MKYIVNNIEKNITLKVWDGAQYSPDFFYDMEIDMGVDPVNEDGSRVVSEQRYNAIVDYWTSEVETANGGGWSEQFGDWRESHAEPEELVLFAD